MAIHHLDSSPLSQPEPIKKPLQPLTETTSQEQVTPPHAQPTNTHDTLNLTQERAAYDAIQVEISQLPDIRQERIREIQNALESGQYQVSSEDLADSLIQDTFLNNSGKEP